VKISHLNATAVCLLPLVFGCGAEPGPPRYHISGTVIFEGQPVRSGHILFEPDLSKGGDGPAGFARIQEGHYDTAEEGEGTIGGPQIVTINGYGKDQLIFSPDDGKEVPVPKVLFRDFQQVIELQRQDSTIDFTIPKEAGK